MVTPPNAPLRPRVARASALLALSLLACRPDTEGRASLIAAPRVLAIRSQPAEAQPGKAVEYSALYALPDGATSDPAPLAWALCSARKPIAVAGPIALECLQPEDPALVALGEGVTASGTLPADVCRVFGPNPPVPKKGEPVPRPADPDSTGGYYQPLRIRSSESDSEYAIGFTLLFCGVGSATQEQTLAFARDYRANENPELSDVVVEPEGRALLLSESADEPTHLVAGQRYALRASWADCPLSASCGDGICGAAEDKNNCAADCTTPRGCTGSEPYVYLDPIASALVPRREALRVSWFATAGEFEHDRSGRSEEDANLAFSDNDWTAPASAGSVRVWVVLRDDRGGVGFRSFYLTVD